jgi:hypothetical protein
VAILVTRSRLAPGLLLATGLLVFGCSRSGLGDLDLGGPNASGGSSSGVHTSSCTPGTTNGAPMALATDASPVMALAVDATSVYWLDWQGNVMKVSKCGGTATTLASAGPAYGGTNASGAGGGAGLAIDSENAYWADSPGDVLAVPLAGGRPTTLASNVPGVAGMTLRNTELYWVRGFGVEAMPIQGGVPSLLAKTFDYSPSPSIPAADDTSIYWVADDGVFRVPWAGGAMATLAKASPITAGLAIDDANVYWSEGASILSTPKTGGPSVTLATDQIGATGFAADGQNVYWTIGSPASTGAVVRVPVAGGSLVVLASGPWFGPIALDDTSVYWAQADVPVGSGTASVMRLSPK